MLQRKQQDDTQLLRRSLMMASFALASLLIGVQWQDESDAPLIGAVEVDAAYQRSVPLRNPVATNAQYRRSATASRAARSQPATQSRLLVDLSDRTVSLFQRDELVADFPIAIGQAGWETPTGTFVVEDMHPDPEWEHPITGEVVPAGPNNPLGSRWIGFWTDGINQIGFHGTNQAELIGLAVSHGCIRMHNSDIEALYEQVEVGTAIEIRP